MDDISKGTKDELSSNLENIPIIGSMLGVYTVSAEVCIV